MPSTEASIKRLTVQGPFANALDDSVNAQI